MKTDQSQDPYKEIVQELREEKMNWHFEDFLSEAEKTEDPITEIPEKKGASLRKFYWMAASVVMLLSIGIFYKNSTKNKRDEQDQFVKNEIIKQKENISNNSEIVAVHHNDSLKTAQDSLVTDSLSIGTDEDLMEKILPKRGRIKRNLRPAYAQNTIPERSASAATTTAGYESDYVIINGQKIENEQEAIDLAKYSLQMLSENVSKTVAHTDVLPNFND